MAEQTVDIIQQTDEQGNPIAGLTPARAVYDEQGTSLDVHLEQNLLRGDKSQSLSEAKKQQMRVNLGLGNLASSGLFVNKPTVSEDSVPVGYQYFCTFH